MSRSLCVLHSDNRQGARFTPGKAFATWMVVVLIFCFPAFLLGAVNNAVVKIMLNQEPKGDYIVIIAGDGDVLIRVQDMETLGIRTPSGAGQLKDGERYVSLRSLAGLAYTLQEKTATLGIEANPALLENKKTVELQPYRETNVYYPHDDSAFLNYGLNYRDGSYEGMYNFNLTNQLGIRLGDYLLLSDSSFTKTRNDDTFVRLMSSVTNDKRGDMQRLVIGDFFASSGNLGSSLNMGGLSFSKIYGINPYFIKNLLFNVTGLVSLPSQADLYLNGIKTQTVALTPGTFEVKDLAASGANTLEVVIKDAFGREQRLQYPFYSSDLLLKRGLHEYSYNAGFLRRNLGVESDDYGEFAFSAFHRYGATDKATVALRTEGRHGLYDVGPELIFIPWLGVMTLTEATSRNEGKTGFAGLLSYVYQESIFNTRFMTSRFSEDYITISTPATTPSSMRIRDQSSAGIGLNLRQYGSLSADVTVTENFQKQDRRTGTLAYSRNLTRDVILFTSYSKTRDTSTAGSIYEIFVSLTYNFGEGRSVSTRDDHIRDQDSESIQMQQNPPVGEGYGYRASLDRTRTGAVTAYTANPNVQYNGRYGIYSADYRAQHTDAGTSTTYQFSASGAIAYVDRIVGLTRPVTDSFGLVKVGNVEGVRVYQNNVEIGTTDSEGKIFVPSLGSYLDNLVSINDRDLPMDVSFKETKRVVSPPFRSGSCIFFNAPKVQPITGMLSVKALGGTLPLEFTDVTLMVNGKPFTFSTGNGGEFYIEQITPDDTLSQTQKKASECAFRESSMLTKSGTYHASFTYQGKQCSFDLEIPASPDLMIDLGVVPTCSLDVAPERTLPKRSAVPAEEKAAVKPGADPMQADVPDIVLVKPAMDKNGVLTSGRDRRAVAVLIRFLKDHPDYDIIIQGYGDRLGSDDSALDRDEDGRDA